MERLHVQLHNNECPDLMLSFMVLGSVACSALPSTTNSRLALYICIHVYMYVHIF